MFKKTKVTLTSNTKDVVDWSPYLEAYITQKEKDLLDDIKFLEGEELTTFIDKSAGEYVDIFLKILKNIHQEREVIYILKTIHYALAYPTTVGKFLVLIALKLEDTYEALLENINSTSITLLDLTYKNITEIFLLTQGQRYSMGRNIQVKGPKNENKKVYGIIESINVNLVKNYKNFTLVKSIIKCLMNLLKDKGTRRYYYNAGGLKKLIIILKKYHHDIQVVYEICFCFWMISFEKIICKVAFEENEAVIPILHHLLKINNKEKIRRVILLTFKNLLEHNELVSILINLGVYQTLLSLQKKNYEDDDIDELFKELTEKLYEQIEELSSFSEYRQEVLVGNLEWSPVHKSEKFWKENLKKFEENDYFIVKKLIQILDNQENVKNLAICCFDIGQLIRFYPRARKVLTKLKAKSKILGLMNHEDEEVKKYALGCVQKLLIQKWEYL